MLLQCSQSYVICYIYVLQQLYFLFIVYLTNVSHIRILLFLRSVTIIFLYSLGCNTTSCQIQQFFYHFSQKKKKNQYDQMQD